MHIDHTEKCLEIFGFPEEFIKAYMQLARNGTVQFEVHSELSEDVRLLRGTAQGDPKSSFGFNASSAPLNHYHYQHGDNQITPIFCRRCHAPTQRGSNRSYSQHPEKNCYKVSGIKPNLRICEILAINCNNADIENLIQQTGIDRVNTLKHLRVHIDNQGNILPLTNTMKKIADSFNSSM